MSEKKRKFQPCIFRAWVTRPDGTRDYARDHGLTAWPITPKKKRK